MTHEEITRIINSIIIQQEECDLEIPIYSPTLLKKRILVFSGGGIKGISFIGALKALEELDILNKIETYAGTSVGTIILFLHIIGYSSNDLMEFVRSFDLSRLKELDFQKLLRSYGLDTGDKIENAMTKFLNAKKIKSDITLQQLFELTKKEFIITSVNINERKTVYLSYKSHPNLPVIKAVRMSISIPFVFTPVHYENNYYIDGGCIDDFPINLFRDRWEELIGIYVAESNNCNHLIRSIEEYAMNVVFSLINGKEEMLIGNNRNSIIKIAIDNLTPIAFDIDLQQKNYLFDIGYKTVKNFNFT